LKYPTITRAISYYHTRQVKKYPTITRTISYYHTRVGRYRGPLSYHHTRVYIKNILIFKGLKNFYRS